MTALDDCCYTCRRCDWVVCRDTEPSPGEADAICADCYPKETP